MNDYDAIIIGTGQAGPFLAARFTFCWTSMYAKAPYTAVQRAMHIHPAIAEYLSTVSSKLEPFA